MNRWVVAAAAVVMMAGLGSFNAWSVFRLPLSELYGANVTEVNTAFFVASLVFGLVGCGCITDTLDIMQQLGVIPAPEHA